MEAKLPTIEWIDLPGLALAPGAGVTLQTRLRFDPFAFGNEVYHVIDQPVAVTVDISRMAGSGFALKTKFVVQLSGPCMRCLTPAQIEVEVSAREVCDLAGAEHLESAYLVGSDFELAAWARDSLSLTLPTQVLCREGCLGLCPQCGENLNTADPGHSHEPPPDPRWDALRKLKL